MNLEGGVNDARVIMMMVSTKHVPRCMETELVWGVMEGVT